MSRFFIFILVVWNPLVVLAAGLAVDRFGQQLGKLGFTGFMLIFYAFLLALFAPWVWDAFGKKGA